MQYNNDTAAPSSTRVEKLFPDHYKDDGNRIKVKELMKENNLKAPSRADTIIVKQTRAYKEENADGPISAEKRWSAWIRKTWLSANVRSCVLRKLLNIETTWIVFLVLYFGDERTA